MNRCDGSNSFVCTSFTNASMACRACSMFSSVPLILTKSSPLTTSMRVPVSCFNRFNVLPPLPIWKLKKQKKKKTSDATSDKIPLIVVTMYHPPMIYPCIDRETGCSTQVCSSASSSSTWLSGCRFSAKTTLN